MNNSTPPSRFSVFQKEMDNHYNVLIALENFDKSDGTKTDKCRMQFLMDSRGYSQARACQMVKLYKAIASLPGVISFFARREQKRKGTS